MALRPVPVSRTLTCLLALLLALPSLGLLAASPAQADGVEEIGPLALPLVDAAAAEDGWRIFLFGGKPCAGACPATNEILEYDAQTGDFAVVAHLPSARSGAAAVVGAPWHVYVFGGVANGTALDEIVRFDLETHEVRKMNATLPTGRHAAAAAWEGPGLRVLGGIDASGLLAQTLHYNVTADAISVSNLSLPEPRARMAVGQAWNATYLLGGENASGYTDSILALQGGDPANATLVEAGARLPAPLAGASAAWGHENVFVFGGVTPGGLTDAVVRYDPGQDRVVAMNASLPSARNGTAAVFSFAGGESFYVFGGMDDAGEALADVVRYHGTPDAPSAVSATPTATGIRLTWTAPPEDTYGRLTGYQVYRGASPGSLSILAYAWPPGNDTWHDETVTPGTWYYGLRAYANSRVGPMSEVVSATFGHAPSAPLNVTAVGMVESVLLLWSAPADPGHPDLAAYRVYRHEAGQGFVLRATVDAPGTSYLDEDLPGEETFRYVVTAVNVVGESAASEEANATTLPSRPPSAPRNLSAIPVEGGVDLAWQPPEDMGTGWLESYTVWRGRHEGERWQGFTVPEGQTAFTDAIPRDETYWYEVTATSTHGTSAPSASVSASGLYTPTAPRDLQVERGHGMLNLTWLPPEHEGSFPVTGYLVYGGNASGDDALLAELGNVTSWSEAPLPLNHTRHYRVAAVNAFGEGARSAEASGTTWSLPSAPRAFSATPGVRRVDLAWSPPADTGGSPITSYQVLRDGLPLAEVPAGTLAYADTGLGDGETREYEVRALTVVGAGPVAGPLQATTFDTPTAPRDLVATKTLSGIRLDWLAPLSNGGSPVTKYVVYRSLSSTSDGTAIAEPTGLTYLDAGCPVGRICYYRVAAVNAVGEGPKSVQAWNVG